MAETPDEAAPAAPDFELVTGLDAFAAKAAELAAGAHMELAILSQALVRRVYGTESFLAAARKFVLQHAHARLRFLVAHPQRAMASTRLIEFGRAMTSRIEFRAVRPERVPAIREEYVAADGRLMLQRESPEHLDAKYFGGAPHLVRLKLKEFDVLWNEAEPAQELRNLGI